MVLIAADTFDSELRNGWGSTDVGGSYTLVGESSDFDVVSGAGTILLSYPAAPRAAYLTELSARDFVATVRVTTDRPPSGGRYFVYLALRRTDQAEYLAKLSLGEGGAVFLEASRIMRSTSEDESSIGPQMRLEDLIYEAGDWLTIEAEVRGVHPTQIRLRAWPVGAEQPDWQIAVADDEPSLQQPGTVGIRARLGQAVDELPVVVSVDDLRVSQ